MSDEEDGCASSRLVDDDLEFSSQPATQPLGGSSNDNDDDDDDSSVDESQPVITVEFVAKFHLIQCFLLQWGMLFPYRPGMRPVELTALTVTWKKHGKSANWAMISTPRLPSFASNFDVTEISHMYPIYNISTPSMWTPGMRVMQYLFPSHQ